MTNRVARFDDFPDANVDAEAPTAPEEFAGALHRYGFVLVDNHGIDGSLIDDVVREWTDFFSNDRKFDYIQPERDVGYVPPSHSVQQQPNGPQLDRKEFFQIRPKDAACPTEVSDAALRLFHASRSLGQVFLGWLDDAMPAAVRCRLVQPLVNIAAGEQTTTLRIQCYLGLGDSSVPGASRALPHRDIDLLTLLPAPAVEGLQICGPDGEWIDVPALTSRLVVNAGTVLERATMGWYPATTHRVVVTASEVGRRPRFSLPLFLHAREDAEICLGVTSAAFVRAQATELRRLGWRPITGVKDGDDAATCRT